MKIKRGETTLRINISFAAVVTFMLILDSSGLCALSLSCCIIHEAGHVICLALLGEKPVLLELSFYGIKLERKNPVGSGIDDIIVFLSGPALNLALSALLYMFSASNDKVAQAAAVNAAVGAFNLLPCRPLDGGNVIHALLCRHMNAEKADAASAAVTAAVIIPTALAGAVFTVKYGNFSLLAVSLYLAAMAFLNKKEKNGLKM